MCLADKHYLLFREPWNNGTQGRQRLEIGGMHGLRKSTRLAAPCHGLFDGGSTALASDQSNHQCRYDCGLSDRSLYMHHFCPLSPRVGSHSNLPYAAVPGTPQKTALEALKAVGQLEYVHAPS